MITMLQTNHSSSTLATLHDLNEVVLGQGRWTWTSDVYPASGHPKPTRPPSKCVDFEQKWDQWNPLRSFLHCVLLSITFLFRSETVHQKPPNLIITSYSLMCTQTRLYLSLSLSLSIYILFSLSCYLSLCLSLSLYLSIYLSLSLSLSDFYFGCYKLKSPKVRSTMSLFYNRVITLSVSLSLSWIFILDVIS